ncbi:UNC5C-like protein [Latimeria chalumnae]|uniref:UNC5C-like protein n=1 Tax=Latimeria chalumnae TaxID=7897 RepID=UPI00313AC7A8
MYVMGELSEESWLLPIVGPFLLIACVLLLLQCLYFRCPKLGRWLLRNRSTERPSGEQVQPPVSEAPELEGVWQEPCPKVTCAEVEDFYKELHTPTDGAMVMKMLLHKLLVFVSKEVDHKGACLMLVNTGISLEIPPGAVILGRTERVSLVLVWDLLDSPELTDSQALISPVVYCGPHGISFKRPCTLTFKHCASNSMQVKAYLSDTHLLASKKWSAIKAKSRTKACVTRDECQIQLSHFSLYTCVLEACGKVEVRKWLQLAIFCSPLTTGQTHIQVRVYFLNNTPCALQWAIANEQPFTGSLCGPLQLFEFAGNTKSLLLVLKYISEGWENTDESSSQLVPFLHIWHGKCPFRSFCFKKKQNEVLNPKLGEIIVTMHTYQSGLQDKYVEILRFHTSEKGSKFLTVPTPIRCNRIPRELFEQLQMLLEPSTVTGNNWKKLASQLGLCGTKIRYFSCQQSPAAATLEIFEERNGSLQELYGLMVSIERLDCAEVIKDYLSRTQVPSGTDGENTGLSDNCREDSNQKKSSTESEADSGLIDYGSLEAQPQEQKVTMHVYTNHAVESEALA